MKRLFFCFLLCLAAAALCGCARTQPVSMPADHGALWDGFRSVSRPDPNGLVSGSLRIGPENDTRRVTYSLWSVGSASAGGRSIRMEVYAGAGASVCSAVFGGGSMTVLLHQEKTAWTGPESREATESLLGARLPLDVAGLYDFITGNYYEALGRPVPQQVLPAANGGAVFRYTQGRAPCALELGPEARPVHLSLDGGEWELDIRSGEDALPSRLSGSIQSSGTPSRFILLAKQRSRSAASSAGLPIPPGYRILRIEDNL